MVVVKACRMTGASLIAQEEGLRANGGRKATAQIGLVHRDRFAGGVLLFAQNAGDEAEGSEICLRQDKQITKPRALRRLAAPWPHSHHRLMLRL